MTARRVAVDRRADDPAVPHPSGVLGDPAGAEREEGERLLEAMAHRLAADTRASRLSRRGRLGLPVGCLVTAPAGAGQ
ncbi:hypothetical protein [Streptomyces sp. NPDC047043]|uniref:hypothetical protein n=1 Tax=Streptomyces sp. NPDC047043 TaxID=3154497 RepID=UPI0033E68AEA